MFIQDILGMPKLLIRDLTEGNKRFVVLDVNNGKEINILDGNDSEQIVSAKLFIMV